MIFGKVEIRPGFFLLAAWIYLTDSGGLLPSIIISAAVHELGHIAMILLTGGQIYRIILGGFGAELQTDRFDRSSAILIWLAGPIASFLLGIAAAMAGQHLIAGTSFALGTFNLLPAKILDGGAALSAALENDGLPSRISDILNTICAILLIGLGAAIIILNGSGIPLMLLGGYLLISD